MENSWAENVTLYGLSNVGATLCAPWLFDPNFILTNAEHVWETGIFAAYHLPDTEDSPYVGATGFGTPHTNFPYGIPVV